MEHIKRETESFLKATQNNIIKIYYIKAKIDNMQPNSKCRLCGNKDKMIYLIIRKVAQKEYITGREKYPLGIVQEIKI